MIDKDALEEEPIGALIRSDVEDDKPWLDHSEDLLKIADEADRREREWRRLYASMKQQNDALARVIQEGLQDINRKLGILEGKMTKGRVGVHIDSPKVHIEPPKESSPLERMRQFGERSWYR